MVGGLFLALLIAVPGGLLLGSRPVSGTQVKPRWDCRRVGSSPVRTITGERARRPAFKLARALASPTCVCGYATATSPVPRAYPSAADTATDSCGVRTISKYG